MPCRYIVAGPVASYKQLGFGLYLMALKETGVPISICGLLKRESMQDIEIVFAFLERFWAKGYAYESAAAAMNYGRTSLGLRSIAATTPILGRRFERTRDKVRLAWRESFAQGVCTYSQKRRGPEGQTYRRRLSGKYLR
jgi:[ribosomal protein S5]-alanine N-acetyltransferase